MSDQKPIASIDPNGSFEDMAEVILKTCCSEDRKAKFVHTTLAEAVTPWILTACTQVAKILREHEIGPEARQTIRTIIVLESWKQVASDIFGLDIQVVEKGQ